MTSRITRTTNIVCATLVLVFSAAAAQAADLTGHWTGPSHTIVAYCTIPPESDGPAVMDFTQTGNTFSGTYLWKFENSEHCIPTTELTSYLLDISGTVTGDTFTADVEYSGRWIATITGTVSGDTLSFMLINPTVEGEDGYPGPGTVVTGQAKRFPTVTSLWPPNHKLVDLGLDLGVTDSTGTANTTFIVYSDEDDGSDGSDADAEASGSLSLRAEREGTGDGRVYLIAITSTDSEGNTGNSCLTAVVPKSQGARDILSVNAQAAAALTQCPSAPAGYFVIER
jgi:hypothetical protein